MSCSGWYIAFIALLTCAVGCHSINARPMSARVDTPDAVFGEGPTMAHPTDTEAYRAQVLAVVRSAMKAGPVDGAEGLDSLTPAGPVRVPLLMSGFAWKPEDVNRLFEYRWTSKAKLERRHCRPGVGVPLVAVRWRECDEPRLRAIHPFAVTAILRPAPPPNQRPLHGNTVGAGGCDWILELHNPLVETEVDIDGQTYPLAADLSAPIEYWMSVTEGETNIVAGFFHPDEAKVKPRLSFVEPYQPGKIPAVFVHGLAADAGTWLATYNDLRADVDFCRRYQVWAFRYPTGSGFLASAASLREALLAAREECDPGHQDAALDQMLLVGHSMGGLLSKLQVVCPGEKLWESIGRGSFNDLRLSPQVRAEVSRLIFFEPTPTVTRVVFIATPHRGASLAARPVARIASKVVSWADDSSDPYGALLRDNLDRLHPWLWMGHPTSVDMLVPGNPILDCMWRLPVANGVVYHSIIGTQGLLLEGGSDSVVEVKSARLPGAVSEVYVPEHHSGIQHHPTTVAELLRIMEEHVAIAPATRPVAPAVEPIELPEPVRGPN